MGVGRSRALSISSTGSGTAHSPNGDGWEPPTAAPDVTPHLIHLCDDVLLEVLSWCGVHELGRLAQTCSQLNELLRSRAGVLWARRAAASVGRLDKRWSDLTNRAATDPTSQFGSVEVGVWSCGVNQGPTAWGVPTPPPFQSVGQLGLPEIATDTRVRRPTLVPTVRGRGKSQPCEVATGGYHTVFLMSDGTVTSCGSSVFGQTGQGTRLPSETPTAMRIPPGHRIASIHVGADFTVLRTHDGRLLACGLNQDGRLGISDPRCADMCREGDAVMTPDRDCIVMVPAAVDGIPSGAPVMSVACGRGHTLALLETGEVLAWGRGEEGQLGDGHGAAPTPVDDFSLYVEHTASQHKARRVGGLPPIRAVTAGAFWSAALATDGAVFIWGAINGFRVSTPVRMTLPEPIDSLHSSSTVLAMVPKSNCVYMVESGNEALLSAIATRSENNMQVDGGAALAALGATAWRVPLPISFEETRVRDVACDDYQVLVLLSSGRLLTWGYTDTRQIHPDFYAVLPAQRTTRVCRIALGAQHMVCLAVHSVGAISEMQKDRYMLWPVLPAATLF